MEKNWQERLKLNNNNLEKNINLMRTVTPLVIPRNNKVEKALEFAEKGDYSFLKKIITILKEPYELSQDKLDYQNPGPLQKNYQTFCGT